jgi:hypothetical protein
MGALFSGGLTIPFQSSCEEKNTGTYLTTSPYRGLNFLSLTRELFRSKRHAIGFYHAMVVEFHKSGSIFGFGVFDLNFHGAIA